MEEPITDGAFRDGLSMSVATSKKRSQIAQETPVEAEEQRVRCLCGKWWAYRSRDTLILRCKLCRRDIVITGENLKIQYR